MSEAEESVSLNQLLSVSRDLPVKIDKMLEISSSTYSRIFFGECSSKNFNISITQNVP